YTITVTISHGTSTPQVVNDTATVSNPAVVVTGGFAFSAIEGAAAAAQTVATFTDPGGPETLADYSASISWGDGTPATAGTITVNGGTFTVSGAHTYAEEGSYTITVSIVHEGLPAVTATSTAAVADQNVVATGGFSITATEG